jgi:hypothetical protein
VHRFGVGHVTLAEDLTGKGHTTRAVGSRPRVTATIHLANAWGFAPATAGRSDKRDETDLRVPPVTPTAALLVRVDPHAA